MFRTWGMTCDKGGVVASFPLFVAQLVYELQLFRHGVEVSHYQCIVQTTTAQLLQGLHANFRRDSGVGRVSIYDQGMHDAMMDTDSNNARSARWVRPD
eukprot:6490488-Amphidinium_carterae.2